jgi:hypothetical protein
VCEAIAVLPFGVTASVGTANSNVGAETIAAGAQTALADLVSTAHGAIYEAKANGGNGTRHDCVRGG